MKRTCEFFQLSPPVPQWGSGRAFMIATSPNYGLTLRLFGAAGGVAWIDSNAPISGADPLYEREIPLFCVQLKVLSNVIVFDE